MSKPMGGLGRGLGSLIPQKIVPMVGAPAAAEAEELNLVHEIAPEHITVNPHQPRVHFEPGDLDDLINSIREHGILQPLVVTKLPDGKYELIAGERRLRASRAIGLKTVPAIVRTANDQQKLELALIENIQRQDLNAVEEAKAYRGLMELFGLTQEQVAARVGKSRPHIANTVRLLELDEDILQALTDGKLTRSHARTLLAEYDPSKRQALFDQMMTGDGMSVREAEGRVGLGLRRSAVTKDPNVVDLERELREAMGTKVEINAKGASGKITLHYYSREELKTLVKRLLG